MSKSVLITGVARGIGRATARVFQEEGWQVIGVDINPSAPSSDLHGYIQADISRVEDSKKVFAQVANQLENLDVLVNNAAIQICKPLVDTEPHEWDKLIDCNLRSVYLCIKYGHPLMKMKGGAIVNVSSIHALATSVNISSYAASKGAVLALTRALAIELAEDNIRVNAVLPGAVDTPMLHSGLERCFHEDNDIQNQLLSLSRKHVIKRIGRPDEIGQAIYFLSDEKRSSFITGQGLVVDGGALSRLSTE